MFKLLSIYKHIRLIWLYMYALFVKINKENE